MNNELYFHSGHVRCSTPDPLTHRIIIEITLNNWNWLTLISLYVVFIVQCGGVGANRVCMCVIDVIYGCWIKINWNFITHFVSAAAATCHRHQIQPQLYIGAIVWCVQDRMTYICRTPVTWRYGIHLQLCKLIKHKGMPTSHVYLNGCWLWEYAWICCI